jgi:ATP-dependent Lhr-like helicase
MARVREADDWPRDLQAAQAVEGQVGRALAAHSGLSHLADYTHEMDELDFEFRFQGFRTRVDVKEKRRPLSLEISSLWPEVPGSELLVLDETSFRALLWAEGLGYLLVHDVPAARWLVFGPWELCLGPRRRFERRGNRGAGEFLKGKLLVDLRTAAASTPELSIDCLLTVVRESRRALRQVEAIAVRGRTALPVVPRYQSEAGRAAPEPEPFAGANEGEEVDPRWAGLDPALVSAVKSRWGWDEPTAVQSLAFPLVLNGLNVLILAPTAGGKTEAALLPLLDVLRQSSWEAPSILMISPLKALLDDQLARYRTAGALTGATVFAWHGDVGRADRQAFREKPTDMLLTTPESLEQLLSRPGGGAARLFSGIRAVVIDEVHTFAGTPRGGQLAGLLERIEQHSNSDIQRIGLSATVGNPHQVLEWLSGSSQRDARLVEVGQPMKGEELAIFSYESTEEAASLVRSTITGKRSLVFASSRRRAEQLAHALGVGVHHSSVSAGGRSDAIEHLISGQSSCIVATASLEMGIDIGDIDLVVNDGAPSDPGSYLQRLGRSGRRSGNRRMMLTVGDPDSLLLALAVVGRARRGDLDAIPPKRGARLVLAQQILALAFERTGIKSGDVHEYLRWSPLFAGLGDEIDASIGHLVSNGWLAMVGDYLVVGPAAQDRFGGARFVDLLATFEGSSGATVVDTTGKRIGTLDWGQVTDNSGEPRPDPIVLGGTGWLILTVDRAAGTVTVVPSSEGRAPSWRGPTQEIGRATWEAAREILASTDVPVSVDDRANVWLENLRDEWAPRLDDPVREDAEGMVVDAFAGAAVHQAVLRALAFEGSVDGPTCRIITSLSTGASAARVALDEWDRIVQAEAAQQSTKLSVRHRELLAPAVLAAEASEFHVDRDGVHKTLEMIAEQR